MVKKSKKVVTKGKNKKKKKKSFLRSLFVGLRAFLTLIILVVGVYNVARQAVSVPEIDGGKEVISDSGVMTHTGESIPDFYGSDLVPVNNNVPYFSVEELNSIRTMHYYNYPGLDAWGRARPIIATITEDDLVSGANRGSLGSFSPSGWKGRTEGGIYDRSHLIAHSLGGADRIDNLVTGTETFNRSAMASVEGRVRDFIQDTGQPVLYRVSPVYLGYELVPRGVLMEGYSPEGGLKFNLYAYNRQTGYTIDYSTGDVYRQE